MKSAERFLDLHRDPATLYLTNAGSKYAIHVPTGQTFVVMAGIEIPLPGCRFPKEWAWARFWSAIHRNWHRIGLAGGVIVALVVLQLCLAITYPGDISAHFVAVFSFWMNSALVMGFSLCSIALFVRYFMGSIVIVSGEKEGAPALLGSGAIDVRPDIIIMAEDGEAPESFEARMNAAMDASEGTTNWILVVTPRQGTFAVRKNNDVQGGIETSIFLRTKPFDSAQFTEAEIVESNERFRRESFHDYVNYCRELAADFRKWAAAAKVGRTNWFEESVNQMKAGVTCLLLLICAALPAQKTAQVRAYLGDRAELLKPTGEVSFIFERREISVTGDGNRNPVELLQSVPFFSDASKDGRLLGIKMDGRLVNPVQQRVEQAAVPSRKPADAVAVPEGYGAGMLESLPDSSEFERMKGRYLTERAKDWKSIKPAIDYYMWRFRFWLILLIGIGGILWVVAKVTARDGVKDYYGIPLVGYILTNAHLWSKGWLFLIMALASAPFALEAVVTFFYTGTLTFGIVAQWAVIAWSWYKVWEFVLPDTPGSKGVGSGNYPGNYQNRLNG